MKNQIDLTELKEINPSSLLAGCILILFAVMIVAATFVSLVYYLGWWLVVVVLISGIVWSCWIVYRDWMRKEKM